MGTFCARCKEEIVLVDGEWLDNAWDEAICYPHDDPDKRHVPITEGDAQALTPRNGS